MSEAYLPPGPPEPPPEILDAQAYLNLCALSATDDAQMTRNPFWVEPWHGRCRRAESLARNLRYTLEQFLASHSELLRQNESASASAPADAAAAGNAPGPEPYPPLSDYTCTMLTWARDENMDSSRLGPPPNLNFDSSDAAEDDPALCDADSEEDKKTSRTGGSTEEDRADEIDRGADQARIFNSTKRKKRSADNSIDPASARAWRTRYAGTPWAGMGDGEVAFWRALYRSAVLHVHPDRCGQRPNDQRRAQEWFDAVHQHYLGAAFGPLVNLAGHLWASDRIGGPGRSTAGRAHLRRHWRTRLAAARRLLADLQAGPAMRLCFPQI